MPEQVIYQLLIGAAGASPGHVVGVRQRTGYAAEEVAQLARQLDVFSDVRYCGRMTLSRYSVERSRDVCSAG